MAGKAFRELILAVAFSGWVAAGQAQWVAFNDCSPGYGSSSNATTYCISDVGPLKNVANGAGVGVTVTITNLGIVGGGTQSVPDYGTPASIVFDGYVNFSGSPTPSLEVYAPTGILSFTFSGLDTNAEYNFQATAVRGNAVYTNRWTLMEIAGALSFSNRHSPGALTSAQVGSLTASQVAVNTGNNRQGVLAWWEHIRPGPSGRFSVTCKQYTGSVPGGSSAGSKGYAVTGFRLEKAPVYSGRTNLPPRVPNVELSGINGVQTVFIIMMENHDWSTILGSPNCPYINNTLLPKASYCHQYYSPIGVHPSEPNYLWLVAGTNFGILNDDAPSANHQSTTNTLFHMLDRAGISWKCYAEDISGVNCPDVDNGQYAVRHNPFVFFDSVRNNLNYCTNHIRPYPELPRDLTNNTVPRFCFIVPNVTNDMHNLTSGSPSTRKQGDDWLSREVPKILVSAAYTNGGALFLTWDEGSNETDGPFGMIVLSPRAKGGGYNNRIFYTHSSALRTMQDIFGVRPYLGDAAYATSLSDLFKTIRLTSAAWVTNGFRLSVTNVIPAKTNYFQVSTDLTTGSWSTIETNIASSTSVTFTDANATNFPARFYRVIELP